MHEGLNSLHPEIQEQLYLLIVKPGGYSSQKLTRIRRLHKLLPKVPSEFECLFENGELTVKCAACPRRITISVNHLEDAIRDFQHRKELPYCTSTCRKK